MEHSANCSNQGASTTADRVEPLKGRVVPAASRSTEVLRLLSHQRSQLEDWVAQPPENLASVGLRAQMVLRCADGVAPAEVAQELGVTKATVTKWCRRFLERGPEGLRDQPRPGVPRSISDEQVDEVIAATVQRQPPSGSWWTIRSMAQATGISPASVSRIWRAHGIRPDRLAIFKLSSDPAFVATTKGFGLYLRPPEGVFVLSADPTEQTVEGRDTWSEAGVDASSELDEELTALHEIMTTAEAIVLDEGLAQRSERDRHITLQRFLRLTDRLVHQDLDVHVVVDSSTSSVSERLQNWRLQNLRFQIHQVPTTAWWNHLLDRWLHEFDARDLGWGTGDLEAAIDEWIDQFQEDALPFAWLDGSRQELSASKVRPSRLGL